MLSDEMMCRALAYAFVGLYVSVCYDNMHFYDLITPDKSESVAWVVTQMEFI
jgi:hypothetical protein